MNLPRMGESIVQHAVQPILLPGPRLSRRDVGMVYSVSSTPPCEVGEVSREAE